jgi:hypothetical protein
VAGLTRASTSYAVLNALAVALAVIVLTAVLRAGSVAIAPATIC